MDRPFATPDISIVIPTYNHAHLIGRCLQSLIGQSFHNWEAIVVNNHSEDNTVEVVRGVGDARIRLINFSNKGIIAASRNKGIECSRADIIAFLDSDDWWYPAKLERSLAHLKDADIVYHDLDLFTPRGRHVFKRFRGRHLQKPVFTDLMRNGSALNNSSVVVRKKMLDVVGGLSEAEDIVTAEDFDLWLRIAMVTDNFQYLPFSLGAYWKGPENTTQITLNRIRKIESVYDRYLELLCPNDRKEAEIHLNYLVGRIKQKMGLFDEAKELFRISIKSRNSGVRLKSLLSIFLIRLCSLTKLLNG